MPDEPRPKIIVDDDWKTRVQKEKEAMAHGSDAEPASEAEPAGTSSETLKAAAEKSQAESALPPASFALLVSTLVTEALAGLGQIPGPDQQTPVVNLPHAKHFIDTLSMLQEKTKGNLTAEESVMLENVLHELRIAFVAISARH